MKNVTGVLSLSLPVVLQYPIKQLVRVSHNKSAMSMPTPTPPSRGLQVLKTALYILAGLVLTLGLIAGVSLTAGADNIVANALMSLQFLGGGAIYNFIAPMLSGFLINLGVITLIGSLILSLLLYALGRLIGRLTLLEARLARLEARF